MLNYTKKDISILRQIKKRNATTELMSMSIKKLQEDTDVSVLKIRQALSKFIKDGYVNEGFKKGNAKTYYITNEGISKLYELLGGDKYAEV